jgi:hypothetical protein
VANVGESPEPATPVAASTPEAGADSDPGTASLDDMAALIAESATGDGEPAPDAAKPDGDKPAADEPAKDDDKPDDSKDAKPEPDEKAKGETPEALRKGFVALARDRKKLQEREARADAKFQAAQSFEQKATLFDNVVKRLHEDPIGLLREAGGDALIDKALDGVIASEKSPAEREIEKLRRDLDGEKQRVAQEKQDQLVANWRNGIVREVEAGGDKYDLTNALGMQEAVIETITQYHIKHNGAVLSVDIAAAQVEKTLEAGLSKSKKFGAREAVKPAVKATPSQKTGGTTLSSVQAGGEPGVPVYPTDDNERFEAVLREMQANGQL